MEYRNYYRTPRETADERAGDTDYRVDGQTERMRQRGMAENGRRRTDGGRGRYPQNGTLDDLPTASTQSVWQNPPLTGFPLAMVYSPEQEFDDVYEPEEALDAGTLFPALNLEFNPSAYGR